MATGIISTGTFQLGPSWLSLVLLPIASIGFVVLTAALVIQLARYRSRLVADFQAPEQVPASSRSRPAAICSGHGTRPRAIRWLRRD
jgi:hypothetical protein